MKPRCIITSEVGPAVLHAELEHIAEYFAGSGYRDCEIVFGFAWGNEYYTRDWLKERVDIGALAAKVRSVEALGLGRLGRDDLYVYIAGLEFQFCHEADLHLDFEESNQAVEDLFKRWGNLGYDPAEWTCDDKGSPEKKVRAYVA